LRVGDRQIQRPDHRRDEDASFHVHSMTPAPLRRLSACQLPPPLEAAQS
jgi:hypothetical protein